jgi:Methyltransferase domain
MVSPRSLESPPREAIDCIFCGPAASEVVIVEKGFEARQCSRCGLIFVSPRPSREEIGDLYRLDEAYLSAESHLAGSGHPLGRLHARQDLKHVRRHVRSGRLLEVGAGNGNVLVEGRRRGFEVCGIELNPVQAAFIRERLGIPCFESIEELERESEQPFDVIFHRDVLSHLFDPFGDFATFNGLLAEGGIMVFETGNLGDVDHSYFGRFKVFQLPDHLFFFGTRNIEELLRRTGFARLAIKRYSILPELTAMDGLRQLRRLATRGPRVRTGEGGNADGGEHAAHPPRRGLAKAVQTAFAFAMFGMRYGVGAIAPKDKRPQTIVVVAVKRTPAT